MSDALIGFTGFVGSSLLIQTKFHSLYNSSNIQEIYGKQFEAVVCAGAPAQKWIANKAPDQDLKKIDGLIQHLKTIKCRKFILISTVDVFKNPVNVDEDTIINEDNLNPYGLHRRALEKFVKNNFEDYLIIRLPGLVGPGLKKNAVYDLLNKNNLLSIDSRNIYQIYPIENLWNDINICLNNKLKLVHLTSEPISVSDISQEGFGESFQNLLSGQPVIYDLRSKYTNLWGKLSSYQYSRAEVVNAIKHYAQNEILSIKK